MNKTQFDLNMLLLGYTIKDIPAGNFNSKYTSYIKEGKLAFNVHLDKTKPGRHLIQHSFGQYGRSGVGKHDNYDPLFKIIMRR